MKNKIIITTVVSIAWIATIFIHSKKEEINIIDNNNLEIISCKVNNKEYQYQIIYDEEENKYIALSNDYLKIDIKYDTEEELNNLITNIFTNKQGTCTTITIQDIDLNL